MNSNMRGGIEAAGKFACGAFSDDGSWSLAADRPAPIPLLVQNRPTLISSDTTTLCSRPIALTGQSAKRGSTVTPRPPAAPDNAAAAPVSSSQINLAWTDSDTETRFKIERCKGSTCANFAQVATVGADVTTYANTGLSSRTTYQYRVRAYNASGNSAYSSTAAATTPKR